MPHISPLRCGFLQNPVPLPIRLGTRLILSKEPGLILNEVFFVQTDVSHAGQVQALIERVVETFGWLDCAFNNAAVLSKMARTGDFGEADFDAEVSSNLKSVWLCMKYEVEQMLRQEPRGGAIVNTSSVNGLGGVGLAALYSMSKAGILALTKSAAQEYAMDGIRVNALVAGGFDTEMLRTAVSQ